MVFVGLLVLCSISSGLGEQVQPTAQGRFDLGLFKVGLEFGEEVVFLCVEVFDLSFELDDFTINAGDNVGFGDLNVIRARSDFSFSGLGVDCGELECAVVVVADVADGDGGKVVERVDGDDHPGE